MASATISVSVLRVKLLLIHLCRNGLIYLQSSDRSFFNINDVCLAFVMTMLYIHSYLMERVYALDRRRVLWRQIWVCTVCQCPLLWDARFKWVKSFSKVSIPMRSIELCIKMYISKYTERNIFSIFNGCDSFSGNSFPRLLIACKYFSMEKTITSNRINSHFFVTLIIAWMLFIYVRNICCLVKYC